MRVTLRALQNWVETTFADRFGFAGYKGELVNSLRANYQATWNMSTTLSTPVTRSPLATFL